MGLPNFFRRKKSKDSSPVFQPSSYRSQIIRNMGVNQQLVPQPEAKVIEETSHFVKLEYGKEGNVVSRRVWDEAAVGAFKMYHPESPLLNTSDILESNYAKDFWDRAASGISDDDRSIFTPTSYSADETPAPPAQNSAEEKGSFGGAGASGEWGDSSIDSSSPINTD